MNPAIAIDHLTKRYGDVAAVDDVTLAVPRGSVCGLLGPNGSGKTTTFKCLLGFARPNGGSIAIDGKPLEPQTFERLVYVPERPALYESMSVAQHLELQRRSYKHYDAARAAELIARFGLDQRKRVERLSKGQHTALALVLAFSIRPELFVLDEPASGLDPIFQRVVLDLIIEAAAGGATVLFSSHQIGQVERAADRVAILLRGRLVLDDDVDDLRAGEKVVEAIFEHAIPSLDGLGSDVRIRRTERSGRMLRVYVHAESAAVAARIEQLGAKSVTTRDVGLEEIFMNVVAADRPTNLGVE
ncbi:MAG: ABC transporter ATP-binding protein [Candidatus Baltobacteraceae bacterium]